jgi:cytoskeletal protein CcmA (bactofilin family)
VWKKEESKPQGVTQFSTTPAGAPPAGNSSPAGSQTPPVSPKASACISHGIKIKGDVTGKEDLFIDGQLDGKLDLGGASVTIGPNGKVKADIVAREIIVRGQVQGKLTARERVQLWSTGNVSGEVQTDRIAIEDGALLRGKVEAGKPLGKSSELQSGAAAGAGLGKSSSGTVVSSGTAI